MKNETVILGVDYGDARTGLAVSAGDMAFGAGCIAAKGMKKTANMVAEAARQKKAELIVVGNPVNMDDTEGERSRKYQAFAEMLREKTGLEVVLWDERLTTVEAHEILSSLNVSAKKRKGAVDELSATLILQEYIDNVIKNN